MIIIFDPDRFEYENIISMFYLSIRPLRLQSCIVLVRVIDDSKSYIIRGELLLFPRPRIDRARDATYLTKWLTCIFCAAGAPARARRYAGARIIILYRA